MSWLTKFLRISAESNDRLEEGTEEVKTATEFLGDAAERLPDLLNEVGGDGHAIPDLLSRALELSAPWLTAVSDAFGEALPPVKAVISIAKFLTRETDPYALGLLACSLAYQSALAATAKELASDRTLRGTLTVPHDIRLHRGDLGEQETPRDFEGFRLNAPLSHLLVRRADRAVDTLTSALGYPETFRLLLIEGVHQRFAEQFRVIISDGKVKDKFNPLFILLQLGGKEVSTYAALQRHVAYQKWRFANSPVLGSVGSSSMRSPLIEVFEPLDCGVLSWGEIRARNAKAASTSHRLTPFDEGFGGRVPLSSCIIELIGHREFDDAIVVQRTAGAGKSVSMLHLCTLLRGRSLRPIRMRMRDLSLDRGITLFEDMALAIAQSSGDDEYDATFGPRPPASEIDLGPILEESIQFGEATISPYVFIFDGWDEISISASEGFRIRIENTLSEIRRRLLSGHAHRVRVILTGRPSDDVNEAKFLLSETPILTIRPFTQEQLVHFVDALVNHNFASLPTGTSPADITTRTASLKQQFKDDENSQQATGHSILGLPLLAILAVWLVLNDRDPPEKLLVERSALYRRLVDLTTREGGNVERLGPSTAKITGRALRDLLQRTAAAMTLRGTEHISYNELLLRLEAGGLDVPESVVDRAVVEGDMAKLMLSFFFNTGNSEQGCEFIHKSFREYLFAEAIVEALKRCAEPTEGYASRAPYWKEFGDGDPMRVITREFGLLLGPQWLSKEVCRHLNWLIGWEIRRAVTFQKSPQALDETLSLDLQGWQQVRDRLVAIWDWWAEGVHMRPQPYRPRGKNNIDFDLPHAVSLIIQMAPPELARGSLPEPVRMTTVDAHLGDALFRLNCKIHFEINLVTGWTQEMQSDSEAAVATWTGAGLPSQDGRRYQTRVFRDGKEWWVFAPSTPDGINQFLDLFIARINAAGWYPEVRFPCGLDLSGVDLRGTQLVALVFSGVRFDFCRIENAEMTATAFENCSFKSVFARQVEMNSSRFVGTNVVNADWTDSEFENCVIWRAGNVPEPRPAHLKKAFLLPLYSDLEHEPNKIDLALGFPAPDTAHDRLGGAPFTAPDVEVDGFAVSAPHPRD